MVMPRKGELKLAEKFTPEELKEHVRAINRKSVRTYHEKNPEKCREQRRESTKRSALKKKFGLAWDDYLFLLEFQNGLCALCGKAPSGVDRYRENKALAVDHCHDTNKVRGLLCDLCNRALGQFKDNPEVLRRAADYVESSGIW